MGMAEITVSERGDSWRRASDSTSDEPIALAPEVEEVDMVKVVEKA